MRFTRYAETLDNFAWLARILQVVTLAMAIVILVLSRQNTVIHVVPPKVEREYWVSATNASHEYIQQMASFYLTTILTVNPDNAKFVARTFLSYLTPEARGRLEATLIGEASYIKSRGLTQAFYPASINFISSKRLSVTGTLLQWVGGKVVSQRNATYNLTLEPTDYAILISDFERVSEDRKAPNAQSTSDDEFVPN